MYECQNCGYEGAVASGPCPGCKLSMPQRRLVEAADPPAEGADPWLGDGTESPRNLRNTGSHRPSNKWPQLPFFARAGATRVTFTKETAGAVLGRVLGYLRRLQRAECSQFVGDALLGGTSFSAERASGRLRRIAEIMYCRHKLGEIATEAASSKYDAVEDHVERANAALRLGDCGAVGEFMSVRIAELTSPASVLAEVEELAEHVGDARDARATRSGRRVS